MKWRVWLFCILPFAACKPGEGDRCNPNLFTDECARGQQCAPPPNCAVAFCCVPPQLVTDASPANCQPCPIMDLGRSD